MTYDYITDFQIEHKLRFKRETKDTFKLYNSDVGVRFYADDKGLTIVGGYGCAALLPKIDLKALHECLRLDCMAWDIE